FRHRDICERGSAIRNLAAVDRSPYFSDFFAVVYLSSKLGQVTGKGLFHVIKENYPRWILWPALVGVLIGDTIEAAADSGGMAAAISLFIPVAPSLIVVVVACTILGLQIWGSYELIRNI